MYELNYSDKCLVCKLSEYPENSLEYQTWLTIENMIDNHEKLPKIAEMAQKAGFKTITHSMLKNHKRRHRVEIPPLTVNREKIEPPDLKDIKIDTSSTTTIIKDLILRYTESIQRLITISLITRNAKDETNVSNAIARLLDILSKNNITLVSEEEIKNTLNQLEKEFQIPKIKLGTTLNNLENYTIAKENTKC